MLKRAGLDYWKHVNVKEYDSIQQLYDQYPKGTFYYVENYGENYYTDVDLSNRDDEIFFIFGKETAGLPKQWLEENACRCLRIHMPDQVRSLNLSNAAAIIVYEALRQQKLPGIANPLCRSNQANHFIQKTVMFIRDGFLKRKKS